MITTASSPADLAPLASIPRRVAGFVLDVVLIAFVGIGVWGPELPGRVFPVPYPAVQNIAIPLLYVLALVVVPAVWGRTAGMALLGMRIRRRGDRGPVGVPALLLRGVLTWADALAVGLVGVVAMANTPDRQRLGDLAAHSVVERVAR